MIGWVKSVPTRLVNRTTARAEDKEEVMAEIEVIKAVETSAIS